MAEKQPGAAGLRNRISFNDAAAFLSSASAGDGAAAAAASPDGGAGESTPAPPHSPKAGLAAHGLVPLALHAGGEF